MIITCGTDFSPEADRAAFLAAALARLTKGELHLVSVAPAGASADTVRLALTAVAAELSEELDGRAVQTPILHGDPALELARTAEAARADLLVVASGSRLGRVAERVAAAATVPVLIVRDDEPIAHWLDGREHLRTILAASLEPSQEHAVDLLSELRKVAACDVTALHVAYPPTEVTKLDALRTATEGDDRTTGFFRAELKRRVARLEGGGEVSVVVDESFGRADDRVLGVASERKAGLIVVGAHRRKGAERLWHASVAASVVRHAKTNVIVVPDSMARLSVPAISSVLVPVDRAAGAGASVALACALAGPGGAVRLLHVVDRAGDLDRDALRAELLALVPRDAAAARIRVDVEIVDAPYPGAAICAAALKSGVDLLCMRARIRPNRTLPRFGSALDEVLARSPRPVVVVREEQ